MRCSIRRSSRPTTCAGSTRPSSTRTARARSGAPTSSSSSRSGSRSGGTCASRRRRWRRRRSRAPRPPGADVVDIGLVGTEMLYFAVGAPRARRRHPGHRLAQPEGVHGDEDRPPRRAARRRRLGPAGHPRPSHVRVARPQDQVPGTGPGGGCLSGLRRQGPVLRRPRRDPAAARRDRRGERDGRRDAAARARAAPDRRRPLLLRARRHVPEPRAEPAAPREPRVRDRQGARGRGRPRRRPSTATPTGASSSTTRASSSRATS